MGRRQALALALAALCAGLSESAAARTWREEFDEAKTEQECRAVYDRMNEKCDFAGFLAGIPPGRQNQSKINSCKYDARQLRDKCVSEVIEAKEEAAAEAEQKAAKAKEDAERKQYLQQIQEENVRVRRQIEGKRPSLVLGCSKRGGSQSFPATLEFLAFQDLGVCVFDRWAHVCTLSAAEFRGTVDQYRTLDSWRISRVTGEMSVERVYTQTNADNVQASYSCDKVTPGATKF